MSQVQRVDRAILIGYNIKATLEALRGDIASLLGEFDDYNSTEYLIDLWFDVMLNDLQIITVNSFVETAYPPELLNRIRAITAPMARFWKEFKVPTSCSGCDVLLKRSFGTLWVVFYNPHELRRFQY